MQMMTDYPTAARWPRWLAITLVLGLALAMGWAITEAQESGSVQELAGRIETGEVILYFLPDLQQGEQLYVHASPVSGNLDPLVHIVDSSVDPQQLKSEFESAVKQAMAGAADPLQALEELRNEFALAWDDDGGGGLTSALVFEVPADGDYRLLVSGRASTLGAQTFGDYRLLIGQGAPEVLTGDALPTGETIAVPDPEIATGASVQEIAGSFTAGRRSTFMSLQDVKPGDTFYAYIEPTSGDLIPALVLQNFARKAIRSGNLQGSDPEASLQYSFPTGGQNYRLEIQAYGDDEQVTSGDYRLLVGINAPEVLTGEAEPGGRAVIREPIEVKAGIKLEQIIDLDQEREFFNAAASLRLEWTHPSMAFNPESCQCDVKTFTGSGLSQFIAENQQTWPAFSLRNQQGNRWIQNQALAVFPEGRAIYVERFSTNFQVDFDFRQFPFDTERFFIRVDSVYPEEYYVFTDLPGYSGISEEHGEDEFILTGFDTAVTSEASSNGFTASRFTFSYEAPRHLTYYLFQIFIPILLIIIVSWVTFFLKDYGRRIEVASANLLLFIAFSWSLADNHPRLGYMTFLDAVMAIMFVVNAMVVVYNVVMSRLTKSGTDKRVERIDSVMDWAYPMVYVVAFGIVILLFF
jgi:hypothetical protein